MLKLRYVKGYKGLPLYDSQGRAPVVKLRSMGITGRWEFSSEEGRADTFSGQGCLGGINSLFLELYKMVLEHCLPEMLQEVR